MPPPKPFTSSAGPASPSTAGTAGSGMRRADRLFQLVQLIRGRRLCTAALLAERLQVSLRTVYRDVADLQQQGEIGRAHV